MRLDTNNPLEVLLHDQLIGYGIKRETIYYLIKTWKNLLRFDEQTHLLMIANRTVHRAIQDFVFTNPDVLVNKELSHDSRRDR